MPHPRYRTVSAPIRCALAVAVLIAGSVGLPGLGGCETTGTPSVQTRRSRFNIDDAQYAKLGYRVDWIGYPVISASPGVQFITPGDDVILTLEAGSTVTALSATDGSVRWSDQLGNRLTSFVGLTRDGNRAVVSAQGDVFQLDIATGNMVNRQAYEKIVATPPVLFGPLAIYGTGIGELLAHVLTSPIPRVKQWGHAVSGAIEYKPVLIGRTVGAVSHDGVIVFCDAGTGSLVGSNKIYRGTVTAPVAGDDAMFVASLDQSVYAFRPDGQLLWQYRTPVPLRQQPALRGRALYVGVDGVGLVALGVGRGEVFWTAKGVKGTVIGAIKNRLIVWDGKTATLLDADRGDVVSKADLPGVRMLVLDEPEDGNLYAVSNSSVVVKFVPR